MNAKTTKIIFWIATGLLAAMMVLSAGMYFANYETVATSFTTLGYPTYLIYPLAVAKILAAIAITTRLNNSLKEWAYAGLFFDFALAATAHLQVGDGEAAPAFVAIALLFVSYFMGKRLDGSKGA
ncbi:MAG: DoxX family protein [Bacteroidota bacterium]